MDGDDKSPENATNDVCKLGGVLSGVMVAVLYISVTWGDGKS